MRPVAGADAPRGRHRTPPRPVQRRGRREVPRASPVGGVDQRAHRQARQPGEDALLRLALEVTDSPEGTVVFA